jgi:hypothetical protein
MTFWDRLVDRLRDLGEQVVEWAILIVIALIVLVIGRWILKLIRSWVEKLLGARVIEPLWQRSGVARALEGGEQTPASIGATLIYAYLMVGLFLIVARILQVTTIEGLLERLLAWIPLLLLAVIVVLIAAAVANWTRNLVAPFADRQGVSWLGTVVYVAVLVFGVLFALELIEIQFASDIVLIIVAAIAVAAAIAFGVGGIDAGKKWWAKYGSPKGGPPTVM